MASKFKFPHELPAMKIGWYNDYINDLSFIEENNIIMIVHNYDLLLINDLKTKEKIMADFEEIILPWWEGEIIGHLVGGMPKQFMIYIENI